MISKSFFKTFWKIFFKIFSITFGKIKQKSYICIGLDKGCIMKFIKFGSLPYFRRWFDRNGRFENYTLIDINYRYNIEEDSEIYRLIQDRKDIGIAFVSNIYDGDMWIDLLEVRKEYRGKGYGSKMVDMIADIYKPERIYIRCAEDSDGKRKGKAYEFWNGRGFHIDRNLTVKDGDVFMVKRFPENKSK